jgi:hypothetical protein
MNVAEGIKTRWKLEQLRVDFDDDPNDVLLETERTRAALRFDRACFTYMIEKEATVMITDSLSCLISTIRRSFLFEAL